jgi:Protein of unknown function (DUF3551)
MRVVFFVFSILVVTAVIDTRAEAQNYPWCAIYDEDGPVHNCGFTTYEQCMADVRGIGGSCKPNNTYVAPPGPHRRSQYEPDGY